jgi:hypothetical protein
MVFKKDEGQKNYEGYILLVKEKYEYNKIRDNGKRKGEKNVANEEEKNRRNRKKGI